MLGTLLEIAFGIVLKDETSFKIFHVIMCGTLVYAVVRTVTGILGIGGKRKKKSTAEIVETAPAEEKPAPAEEIAPQRPTYFRVRQNPEYVMAEYPDKYELYRDTGKGLEYVRTDYKGE